MPLPFQDNLQRHEFRENTGQGSVFRPQDFRKGTPITLDQRSGAEMRAAQLPQTLPTTSQLWASLPELRHASADLERNTLFPVASQRGVAQYFDMLRTRVLHAMAQQGWRRLAITGPRRGVGSSFVASNLALALGRLPSCRTLLMDLDLRAPQLGKGFGLTHSCDLPLFLRGKATVESVLWRFERNLALALNSTPVTDAAKILQDMAFSDQLLALQRQLQPDILLFDTPPMLMTDDVISLAGTVDAVLLVIDGTATAPADLSACERMLDARLPLLAVVLNKAQDYGLDRDLTGKL